jgi:hypothetical protein
LLKHLIGRILPQKSLSWELNGDSIHPLQLGGAGGGSVLFVWSRSYYGMYLTMPAWTMKRWYLGWLRSQALNRPFWGSKWPVSNDTSNVHSGYSGGGCGRSWLHW